MATELRDYTDDARSIVDFIKSASRGVHQRALTVEWVAAQLQVAHQNGAIEVLTSVGAKDDSPQGSL